MKKQMNQQLFKMLFIMGLLAVLCSWQIGFILTAINSNVMMNGAIIAAFFGSAALAIYSVFKLRKELVAMEALQEMWTDVRENEKMSAKDPFWRHYRALKPGKVFQHPKILGHAYDLVSEEILRTGKMKIGVGTVATLMHKIESKLTEERALLNYLSGLLVFMGLIGAFIGLLKMVGSISGIIGSLSAASGSGGAAEAFQQMLTDLQQPLSGMATGFASSLFGLFTSLVIGLMARFAAQAQNALKNEFESMLIGMAQIDNSEAAAIPVAGSGVVSDLENATIKNLTDVAARSALAVEQSNKIMESISAHQASQTQAVQKSAEHFGMIAAQQTALQEHMKKITAMANSLDALKTDIKHFEKSVDERVSGSIDGLTQLIQKTWAQQSESLSSMAKSQVELTAQLGRIMHQNNTSPQLSQEAQKGLELGIAQGFGKISQVLEANSQAIAHNLNQMTRQQISLSQLLAKTSNPQPQMPVQQQAPVQPVATAQKAPLAAPIPVMEQRQALAQKVESGQLNNRQAVQKEQVEEKPEFSQAQLEEMASRLYATARKNKIEQAA